MRGCPNMKMKNLKSGKLFTVFFVLISFITFQQNVFAQKSTVKQKPKATATAQTHKPQPSIFDSAIETVTSVFSIDPYYQFRNVSYSNESLLTEQDEIKLGSELHKEIIKKYKITTEGQARVVRIGQKIVNTSRRSNLKYNFFVYQANEINAFATPGGYIYVATGLLKISSDDELASVMSHEVGHIVARHSLKSLQNSQTVGGIADLIGSITGIAGKDAQDLGKMATQILASPILFAYSREQEREADFLGINNLHKAGFNINAMVTMFEKLQKIRKTEPGLLDSIFSSHPDVDERIENTKYEINRLTAKKKVAQK